MNDLTGRIFGRLTVLRRNPENDKCNKSMWVCYCECNPEKEVIKRGGDLIKGDVQSCGCLRKEISKEHLKTLLTTHNETNTHLFSVWTGMKKRCYYENGKDFEHYGERGIIICNQWLNSYIVFRDWSIDNGYDENLTIDRIDVNGDYEPSNCRWTTTKVQNNNKTNNLYIMIDGKTKTLSEWCSELNLIRGTIYQRIHKYKWDVSKALGVNNAVLVYKENIHA